MNNVAPTESLRALLACEGCGRCTSRTSLRETLGSSPLSRLPWLVSIETSPSRILPYWLLSIETTFELLRVGVPLAEGSVLAFLTVNHQIVAQFLTSELFRA